MLMETPTFSFSEKTHQKLNFGHIIYENTRSAECTGLRKFYWKGANRYSPVLGILTFVLLNRKTITMKSVFQKTRTAMNAHLWYDSKKVHSLHLSLIAIVLCSFGTVAQESSERPTKIKKELSANSATASVADFSAANPELKEFEAKINNLLTELRKQLVDDSNKAWFAENLEKSLGVKSDEVCPNVHLLELMMGNETFVCAPNINKQELLHAIDLLNVSLNGMLTK